MICLPPTGILCVHSSKLLQNNLNYQGFLTCIVSCVKILSFKWMSLNNSQLVSDDLLKN